MSEFIILGKDERDVEAQLAFWLREKRGIRINRVTAPKHERATVLTRLGGDKVHRVSMLIDYEDSVELKEPSDVAAQFNELQRLRERVRMAECYLRRRRCRAAATLLKSGRNRLRTKPWPTNGLVVRP